MNNHGISASSSFSCILETPVIQEQGCYGWWQNILSCPTGHTRQTLGDCSCLWGICSKSKYGCRRDVICCDGYDGMNCDVPICPGGCGLGDCISPGVCVCSDGFSGTKCQINNMVPEVKNGTKESLKVMTLNFACRDMFPLAACDNCQTRFDLIADAFDWSSSSSSSTAGNYDGLPDLDTVDVVLAQELGTDAVKFEQISRVLANRGFLYSTEEPSPRSSDPICSDPIPFDESNKDDFADLTGLESGGLVTWSRYPIVATARQNWCVHTFPAPSGYLTTLLDMGNGRAAAVINLHAMPEYDFGVDGMAESVRAYQFGELSGLAQRLGTFLSLANIPSIIVLGGDFNEDAYNRNSQESGIACGSITSELTRQKFASVGLDIATACAAGNIGTPTWDPTNNDLTGRFSPESTHQVLDYLIQYSSSPETTTTTTTTTAVANVVSVFRTVSPWIGEFCEDNTMGELGNVYEDTAFSLSDHNLVTAEFDLPGPASSTVSVSEDGVGAFHAAISEWNSGQVDGAACGQEGTMCVADSDCCRSEFSWNGSEQRCNGFTCEPCLVEGEACGWQFVGSDCCNYDDYTSGNGLHCDTGNMFSISGACVTKFESGEWCSLDGECQSNRCNWLYRCD